MVLVDQWGRRPLTVYGYMVTVCADFGMGATGMFDVAGRPELGSLLVFFACLATFSTTSSSAIGYAYLAEIPKQDFRAKSAGWGLAIPNLFSIMVSSKSFESRTDWPSSRSSRRSCSKVLQIGEYALDSSLGALVSSPLPLRGSSFQRLLGYVCPSSCGRSPADTISEDTSRD